MFLDTGRESSIGFGRLDKPASEPSTFPSQERQEREKEMRRRTYESESMREAVSLCKQTANRKNTPPSTSEAH